RHDLTRRFQASRYLGHVLVPSARQTENVESVPPRVLQQPGHGVRGLQRRDDALEAGELGESGERLLVRDADIAGPAAVAQVSGIPADAGLVEAAGRRGG